MTIDIPASSQTDQHHVPVAASVDAWRSAIAEAGAPPAIAIAGSRGKSTVAVLLDAMLIADGQRTARWTAAGVTIAGRRQRGELVPWRKALAMIESRDLDAAIQVLDWDTIHAVGLPESLFPVTILTNLCANNDTCMARPDTDRALAALSGVLKGARPDGVLVVNADDSTLITSEVEARERQLVVGIRRETPYLRRHLDRGGAGAWVEDGWMVFGTSDEHRRVVEVNAVPTTAQGALSFAITNALLALCAARAIGVTEQSIISTLQAFQSGDADLPASFNMYTVGGATAVADVSSPSWFLRSALRGLSHLAAERRIRVVGVAGDVPRDDLVETGRLLGRGADILIIHSEDQDPERTALVLQGAAANDVPPLVVHAKSESSAMTSLVKQLREGDLAYVIADDASLVLRRLAAAANRFGNDTI